MASLASGSVVRQIGLLFEGSAVSSLSDRQLLDRFVARRDSAGEAAFAALVVRHGPMVLGVCRQLLGDRQHAEDAFQAVFLVLAQKAGSIRDPDLLGNWIYGVAVRTSRCAKARLGAGKFQEVVAMLLDRSSVLGLSAEQSLITREQAEVLHGEIERLPARSGCRSCCAIWRGSPFTKWLAGWRCSHGTVRSRMALRTGEAEALSHAAALFCPRPRWPRLWISAGPRRRFHLPCARSQRSRRSGSRPVRPPRQRRWPLPARF